MFAYAGTAVISHDSLNWTLLFARQPEPDLDFEEDLTEETQQVSGGSSQPGKAHKGKGGSPFKWILLLVLLGGGAYVAMDPDSVLNTINEMMGESPAPVAAPPPPVRPAPPTQIASPPASPAPAPVAATPPAPMTGAPGAGQVPSQPTTAQAPATTRAQAPTPAPTAAPKAPMVSPVPQPAPAAPAPVAIAKSTTPLFGEGQRVTITSPAALTLTQDALGKLPGPSVKPGSMLVVLDGDLQPSGWVYQVRTDVGAKGWAQEKALRLVP